MSEALRLTPDRLPTPMGDFLILADQDGNLRAADWADHETRLFELLRRQYGKNGFVCEASGDLKELVRAIGDYFSGNLHSIDHLPVRTAGTVFQREVWRELRKIPPGTTISYGQLAVRIGRPAAVRAVGLANGANPVSVVVPCHRVIGSDGSLTGYGGGIERKRWLLNHESALNDMFAAQRSRMVERSANLA